MNSSHLIVISWEALGVLVAAFALICGGLALFVKREIALSIERTINQLDKKYVTHQSCSSAMKTNVAEMKLAMRELLDEYTQRSRLNPESVE